MFFRLSSLELGLVVFGIVVGATLLGWFAGHALRAHWKAQAMRFVTIPELIDATGFAVEPAPATSGEDA